MYEYEKKTDDNVNFESNRTEKGKRKDEGVVSKRQDARFVQKIRKPIQENVIQRIGEEGLVAYDEDVLAVMRGNVRSDIIATKGKSYFLVQQIPNIIDEIIENLYILCKDANTGRKEKKYYLFQDVRMDVIKVDIISPLYEKRSCELRLGGMESAENLPGYRMHTAFGIPVLSIVLYPGEEYILPSGYVRRECEGRPLEEIRVVKNRETAFFLAEDYRGGNRIKLLMAGRQETDRGYLRIESRYDGGYEDFAILERRDGLLYVMDRELNGQYEKGSKLYELYCTMADEEGKAAVIVKNQT